MNDCCYKSVFGNTIKRIGRCNYKCDKCGDDVSMLWAFYNLSKMEEYEDIKDQEHIMRDLITPASQDKE